MKLIESLNNIDAFLLTNNQFYLVMGNILLDKSKNININLRDGESKAININLSPENDIYVLFSDGKCYYVKDMNVHEVPHRCHTSNIVNGKVAIYEYDFNILKTVSNIYDIYNDKIILNEGITSKILLMNNGFITVDEKMISMRTFSNDLEHWDFPIDAFPKSKDWKGDVVEVKVEKMLGSYENISWFQLNGSQLIGLDKYTGELKHRIKDIIKGGERNNFLDPVNGLIITLSHDYYAEFDLHTLELNKQSALKNSKNIKIVGSTFYIGDNNLYFYGHVDSSNFPNAFGIFDREKEEITFWNKADEKGQYFFEPPKSTKNLMAVKDSKNTLFVFEKSPGQAI